MKNFYLVATIALLSFSSCQKKDEAASQMANDTITAIDTTVVDENVVVDSTVATDTTDVSNVDLPNELSTKTTTVTTDPSKGKYALAETKWKLVELNGKAVKSSTNKDYFINLDSKSGKFAAYAGCNNFAGTFVMKSAEKLAFSKIMGTKMACPNMDFENNFIKTIEKTDNYMIEGTMLHLHKGKKAIAKFEAVK
ncbi:META domain-containing protein [Flavobacterium sp.]|uniref:META domain-containing protein n=1 Tax=Flavobacterium sp. TaxID=239 RepID=UPI00375342C3